MAKVDKGLCITFTLCGCIIYGVYALADHLIHRSQISDVKTDLSVHEVGGVTYEIESKDTVFAYDPPIRNRYNFSTGILYQAYDNLSQFISTPFPSLRPEGIEDARQEGCSIARSASEKFKSFDPVRQTELEEQYKKIQAFYQLNCK